ncbi:PaaI family thioesterase [Parendozoicomonas haliclonae]|uniref:Thioesterase domain-containing protein n=1 Tax=Parendozoicomonas haliclonae TaxID=1960125 RepID=A0A1X7AK06_9GAMM|nr:PaaI family thioesterase [Parendozoicomonas haliclonae]SMA47295.1 hypothetical protein EHSB41UT_02365 [Parendozoicomonas haliclonae]
MANSSPDDQKILIMAQQFLKAIPHCHKLGMTIVSADSTGVVVELPWSEDIVGNPETGVIHSGVVTTLMDSACGISTVTALPEPEMCPTLDLRIDHMGKPEPGRPLYASVAPYRVTSNIIFTRGTAWQNSPDEPIAHCVGTFMRLGKMFGPKGKVSQPKSKSEPGDSAS